MNTPKLSLLQITRRVQDNESAEEWLIKHRWKNVMECTHCESNRGSERRKAKRRAFLCKDCRRDFSIKTGSIMQKSNIEFREWSRGLINKRTRMASKRSERCYEDIVKAFTTRCWRRT